MTVTPDQVATLRALLVGDIEGHKRAFGQLDREAAKTGYTALLAAAFAEAVERRFANGGTKPDVVAFVGNVRVRTEDLADSIEPHIAERLILAVFTDEEIDDIDAATKYRLYPTLLAGLIVDEQFSGPELDAFLSEARELADEWLA